VLSWFRWIGPSLVPALLLLAIIYFSDRRREPLPLVLLVFALGGLGKGVTYYAELRASAWTELDTSHMAGAGSLIFLFFFAALLGHMWVGLRDVLLDYAKPASLRHSLLAAVALGLLGLGIWLLSILLRLQV